MGMTTNETPMAAAQRLSSAERGKGYKFLALHEYTDKDGCALFYRIRLKHENGER